MGGFIHRALVLASGLCATAAAHGAEAPARPTAPTSLLSPTLSGPASAFSIGPVVGLGGIGIQAGYRFNTNFGARAGLAGLRYSDTVTSGDLRVKASSSLIRGTIYGDWYPFDGGFRVSAGLGFGRSTATVQGEASDGVFNLNGYQWYAGSDITSVTGKATWNSVVPQLTVGYEALPFESTPLTLTADIGLAYLGKPKVKLTASGPAVTDPLTASDLQSDLNAQEASIRNELGKWPVMPVVTIGALYRF